MMFIGYLFAFSDFSGYNELVATYVTATYVKTDSDQSAEEASARGGNDVR